VCFLRKSTRNNSFWATTAGLGHPHGNRKAKGGVGGGKGNGGGNGGGGKGGGKGGGGGERGVEGGGSGEGGVEGVCGSGKGNSTGSGEMKVLVGCEYSGRVRQAFRNLGHDAWSCDFLESKDGSPYHIIGDVLLLLSEEWDLAIFHPPCTYLSVSGMHWTTRGLRDPQLTEDALEFVKQLMNAPIKRIAIENPISVISSRIRKPDQIIQPYMFGHDASKKTCLWLKNLSKLQPTSMVEPTTVDGKSRWGNQTKSGQNKLGPSSDRWKIRSETYQGIADAMATQWS